jgi:hypothetical protein
MENTEVKIVRLMSGEEIICNYKVAGGMAILKDPAVLIPSPEGKLLLARWLPYADHPKSGVEIPASQVLFALDPQKDLSDHYVNVVVNNLVVPGKKLVNPLEDSKLKLTV